MTTRKQLQLQMDEAKKDLDELPPWMKNVLQPELQNDYLECQLRQQLVDKDSEISLHVDLNHKQAQKMADLEQKLAQAQSALKAVRNYPGIKVYVGTQILDKVNAAIASPPSPQQKKRWKPEPPSPYDASVGGLRIKGEMK